MNSASRQYLFLNNDDGGGGDDDDDDDDDDDNNNNNNNNNTVTTIISLRSTLYTLDTDSVVNNKLRKIVLRIFLNISHRYPLCFGDYRGRRNIIDI
jgi:hypothetical protein